MRQHGLNTLEQRMFLQNTAYLCDRVNNGIARKEVIDIIFDMCGSKTHNQAKNHLGYFIRYGQLPDLKADGSVVCEKNTTINHYCIHVE